MPAESTRDRIVRVAAHILESEGRDAVTLRRVGAEAGVSRGAPYRHFPRKNDLLAEVAARCLDGIAVDIAQAARSGAEGFRLEPALQAYLRAALDRGAAYELAHDPSLAHEPRLVETATRALATVSGVVAAALPHQPPERVRDLTALVWSTLHGLVSLQVAGHTSPAKGMDDPQRLVSAFVAVLTQPTSSLPAGSN